MRVCARVRVCVCCMVRVSLEPAILFEGGMCVGEYGCAFFGLLELWCIIARARAQLNKGKQNYPVRVPSLKSSIRIQRLVKWQLQSEREQRQAMVKDTGLAEKYGTSWHLTKKQVCQDTVRIFNMTSCGVLYRRQPRG